MGEEELRRQATKRLKAQADARRGAVGMVGLWVLMIVIWALTGRGYFWPAWVILGTGIGVAVQWYGAFGPVRRQPAEADVQREMDRLRGE